MRKLAGLMVVVLALVLLAVAGGQWVQRSLVAAGVEQLDWQQLRWRDGTLQLAQLSGAYVNEQGRIGVRAQDISLRPAWRGGPRIERLLIDDLQLIWQPAETLPSTEDSGKPWTLPALQDLGGPLGWLPDQLQVSRLQVQLPCENDYCQLQGDLQLTSQQQPLALTAELQLAAQSRVVTARAQLQEQAGRYHLQAGAQIPEALPLAGLGELSGDLALNLENQGDQWLLHQGQMHVRLNQPQLQALATLPEQWRPRVLNMQVTPQPGSLADWQDSLQLAVSLQMEGPVSGQLAGDLALARHPQWQVQVDEARLQLSAERLNLPGMQLQGATLDWPLHGSINAEQLSLQLGERAPLNIRSLALADDAMILRGVSGQLGNAILLLPLETPEQLKLTSPLMLGVEQLQQAALKPQGWNLQGNIHYSDAGVQLNANLAALSGLNSQLQLDWPADQAWQLRLTLAEIFLRAANPLAATFADWPELLNFSSGRVTGQLQASGRDSLERLNGQLSLAGGEGIYDRASFTGLSLPLQVSLQRGQLRLATDALRLASLDPGLPLGPLSARASYSASLDKLGQGLLEVGGASMGVLDGWVRLEPASIQLGQARQSLVAVVEGVELARLFEVYPAEGLSGRGTLDGRFPVSLVNGNLLIEDGQLQAREPGGVLRYRAQQLQDMAANNPNLEQLAAALDDFRYGVLASDVSYDEQGVLQLGLRLEGSNPAFQQGRQVNLNIQLEEDIPALLTSLQLSGQVNEIIRKRIEQRYLQQRSSP